MNEKPQEARGDEREDLLEQIITHELEKMSAPEQTAAAEETSAGETGPAPNREDSGGNESTAARKSRQSAVYLYLLILFGAAFLMLLLAYFVQRRSSESTISDLRDSMNLSRKQLLDQISSLEKEKGALLEEIDHMNSDLIQWQKRYDEQVLDATVIFEQYYAAQELLYSWSSFWTLERYYQAGDYESCGALLILQRQEYRYRTPEAAQERYGEIVQSVIDAGVLDGDYALHLDKYEDLLDAYLENHSVDLLPMGC